MGYEKEENCESLLFQKAMPMTNEELN